jgi:hypothetical protein
VTVSKDELHEVLQQHARSQPGVPPLAILARWVVVRELVLPTGERALNRATGDLGGDTLTPWDVRGFLGQVLESLPPGSPLRAPAPRFPQDPPDPSDVPF